jgi:hypothetical protein
MNIAYFTVFWWKAVCIVVYCEYEDGIYLGVLVSK